MNNQNKKDLKAAGYVPSAYRADSYVSKSSGNTVTGFGAFVSFNKTSIVHKPTNDVFKRKL